MTPKDSLGIERITLRKKGELTNVLIHLKNGWAAEFEGIADFKETEEGNEVVSIGVAITDGVLVRIFKEEK